MTLCQAEFDGLPAFPGRKRLAVLWCGLYVLFSIAALYFVDDSQYWEPFDDDFALYIAHAKNLVDGRSYTDTNFVFNPADALYSPRAYPPGFPAMLFPAYAVFGLSMRAFKTIVTVTLLLSLPLVALLLSRTHGRDVGLAATALFALSPFMWGFQRYILPDIPFLLLSMLVLLVLEERAAKDGAFGVGLSILAGLLIYAAVATRIIGLALLVAAVCYDLLRRPRPIGRTAVMVTAFAMAWGVQRSALGGLRLYYTGSPSGLPAVSLWEPSPHSGMGVSTQPFAVCLGCIPRNMYQYLAQLAQLAPLPHSINMWFACGFIFAVITGLVYRGSRMLRATARNTQSPIQAVAALPGNFSVSGLYALLYTAILMVMQFSLIRYLVPVMPFLFAYAVAGGMAITQRFFSNRRTGVLIVTVAGLAIYGVSFVLAAPKPDARIDVQSAETQRLFSFVRNGTPKDSLIAFEKPRALALFTGRRATRPGGTVNLEDDLEDLVRRGVNYVLVINGAPSSHLDDPVSPRALKPEFSSEHFTLLRLIPDLARPAIH